MYGEETAERQYSEYSETGDVSQILVWDIPRTVNRSGGWWMKSVEQKAD